MNAGVWSITPGTWTPVINNVVANQGQWISSHGNTWADASWTFHTCGNWVEPNEQCDDTNSIDGDGCSSSCQLEDGFFCSRTWVSSLNGGAGAYKTVCSDAGQCGNGLDNVVLNIEDQWGNQITETKHCDDGGYCSDNAGECGTAAFPGVTNCGDPGTATCIAQSGDGCNSNCQVEEDAACASNHFSGNAIPSICVPGVVGDGVISSVEQCDVGDNFCQTGCCNGRVQINNGWTCDSSVPSVCAHTCGDGFVNGIGEQCDTGGICDNVAYTTRQACGNNGAGWHIGANDKTEAECTGPDEYFSSSSGYCYAMGCNSDCALQYGYKYDSGTGKTVSASYAEMVAVNLAGIRSIDGLNRWGPEGLSNPNIPVTNCYDGDVIGNACSDTGGWNAGYTCTSDVNQIPMDVCVDSCANGRGSSGYCNVVGGTHSGQCDVSTGGLLVGFNYGDLIVSESIGDGVFTNDHICVWSHYGVGNPYDQVSTQANYEAQNSGNGNGNGGLDCTAGEVNGNCECWGNGVGVGVGCDTYDGSTNGYLDGVCRPDGSDLVCLENMKIYVKSTLAEAADGTNHFDVEDQNSPPPVAIDDTAYHFELGDLDGKSKFILHKDFMGPIDNLFANDFFGIQPGFETFPATIAYTYVSNVGVIPFPKLLAIDAAPGEYICKKNNAHDVPTFINYASIYGASCDEMVSVDNIATSCVVGNDYAGTARTLCGTDLGGGKVLMASLFSGGSVEYCGDGIINGSLGEQCDDGGLCSDNGNECGTVAFPGVTNCANANASCVPQNGDGCNENCQNEGSAAVPEFSDYAIALLLLTVVGGFVAMRRKQY